MKRIDPVRLAAEFAVRGQFHLQRKYETSWPVLRAILVDAGVDFCPPRPCRICGTVFRSNQRNANVCSLECKVRRLREIGGQSQYRARFGKEIGSALYRLNELNKRLTKQLKQGEFTNG